MVTVPPTRSPAAGDVIDASASGVVIVSLAESGLRATHGTLGGWGRPAAAAHSRASGGGWRKVIERRSDGGVASVARHFPSPPTVTVTYWLRSSPGGLSARKRSSTRSGQSPAA